jgi:hypothetical protein
LTVPWVKTLEANVGSVLATTNQQNVIGRVPYAAVVTAVTFIPNTSIAAPASGTGRTYTVLNRGTTGASSVTIASRSVTSNVGLSDNQPFDLTLSATTASLIVASGDVLEAESTALTSNAPDPGGKFIVTFSRS